MIAYLLLKCRGYLIEGGALVLFFLIFLGIMAMHSCKLAQAAKKLNSQANQVEVQAVAAHVEAKMFQSKMDHRAKKITQLAQDILSQEQQRESVPEVSLPALPEPVKEELAEAKELAATAVAQEADRQDLNLHNSEAWTKQQDAFQKKSDAEADLKQALRVSNTPWWAYGVGAALLVGAYEGLRRK